MSAAVSSSPARRHAMAWLTAAALLAAIAASVALCAWSIQHVGLTVREADMIAAYTDPTAAVPAGDRGTSPFLAQLMGLASRMDVVPLKVRWPFLAMQLWCLFLLASLARRSEVPGAALWTLLLAVPSAMWLPHCAFMESASMAICGALVVQWAFAYVWPAPTISGLCRYAAAVAIGLYIAPCAVVLVMTHLLWTCPAAIAAVRDRQRRAVALRLGVACIVGIGAVIFVAQCTAAPAWSAPGMKDMWAWWRGAIDIVSATLAACAGGTGSVAASLPITCAVAALAIGAGIVGIARHRGEARVWLGIIVFMPVLGRVVFGPVADGKGMLVATVCIWPFVVLLCGTAVAGIFSTVSNGIRQIPRRIAAIAAQVLVVAVAACLAVFWARVQATGTLGALGAASAEDLDAPVRFLTASAHTSDVIALVFNRDIRRDRHARYYLAPFIYHETAVSVKETTSGQWKTNAPVLPEPGGHVFLVGLPPSAKVIAAAGLTNLVLPFATPITVLSPTATWSRADDLHMLQQAMRAVPLGISPRISGAVVDWYRAADPRSLQNAMLKGWARSDLAVLLAPPDLLPKLRHAVNRVLYAWCDLCLAADPTALGAYDVFNSFVRCQRDVALDRERVVYIYRLYIERALLASNTTHAAAAILRDARTFDRTEPHLDRLDAQLAAIEAPAAIDRIRTLNAIADTRYRDRFGRPFIEALFANALLERQQDNTKAALDQCKQVLELLDRFFPDTGFAAGTTNEISTRWWESSKRFWEAQCNSYIALILLNAGDYKAAIEWQVKNLDPRYEDIRRRVAQERLAHMYIGAGELNKALDHFGALASNATSVNQRVHWMLQSAQLNVTYGEAVGAYDQLGAINAVVATLPRDEQIAWSKNQQYQRLLRYVEHRLDIDMRDTVATALRARAEKDALRRAWYFRQIGQIERCRLQYDRADNAFAEAIRAMPEDPDAYLDAALLQLRLTHYAQARQIMSNAVVAVPPAAWVPLDTDWRHRTIAAFLDQGKPPDTDAIIAWGDRNASLFGDPARYHHYRGNLLASLDRFDAATNEFTIGIAYNEAFVDNYLDLGYLLCTRIGDERTSVAAGDLLDRIAAIPLSLNERNQLEGDWRLVELHHVSIRPYTLQP